MLRNTGGRVNPAAYQDYLMALGYMGRYDKSGNWMASTALEAVNAGRPNFALGYSATGEAFRLKYRVDRTCNG